MKCQTGQYSYCARMPVVALFSFPFASNTIGPRDRPRFSALCVAAACTIASDMDSRWVVRHHMEAVAGLAPSAPEFFGLLPLASVALFALNNLAIKHAFPGFVTGKLSDVLFCFFMPLYLSAVLGRLVAIAPLRRVAVGVVLTALMFTAVKTSSAASRALDAAIAMLTGLAGARHVPNRVDPTDLVALPALVLAWLYARAALRRTCVVGHKENGG